MAVQEQRTDLISYDRTGLFHTTEPAFFIRPNQVPILFRNHTTNTGLFRTTRII
jgi:hypothetical protein